MDLVTALETHAYHTPEKIVYTFLDNTGIQTLNFAQLSQHAKSIAAELIAQGARTNDRILIALPQGLNYLMTFLGCLYAQLIAVPIYPPLRANQIERTYGVIKDAQPKFIITHNSALLANKLNDEKLKYIDITAIAKVKNHFELQKPTLDTIAFLQYTSGSTGEPKGVIVKHQNLVANFQMMQQGLKLNKDSKICSWLPLFHDMGLIGAALQAVNLGASLFLMSPIDFIKRPVSWLKAISNYQGTHAYAPNFAYEMCIQEISPFEKNQLDLSSWQVALNGAEPVRVETMQRFIKSFQECGFNPKACYPAYGLAEATLYVSGKTVLTSTISENIDQEAVSQGFAKLGTADSMHTRDVASCGQSWLEEKIVIVDPESRCQLAVRQVGEIWVGGPHICSGYWNKLELSDELFNAYTADTQDGPYLRTGDLGYLNEQGELFIVSRIKDLIIIRGKNYAPQDIEATVENSSDLINTNSVAAFSVEKNGQEYLVVVIEIRAAVDVHQLAQLSHAIRKNILADHSIIASDILFVRHRSIPKTTSGKLQRQLCKRYFLSDALPLLQPIQVEQLNEVA